MQIRNKMNKAWFTIDYEPDA